MDGQEFFSNVSATYYQETFGDLKTLSSFGRARRTARVLRTLDRLVKSASVVADIGCGPAQLAAPITAMGHEYIGVDPNPEMYSLTAEKLRSNPQARFFTGAAEEIPLSDASVDAVTCIGVVEYLPDRVRALREVFRILRPKGIAILTFPNLRNPVQLLREAVHPVAAPMLRALIPKLRTTVYVSGTPHAVMFPGKLRREAASVGLTRVDGFADGYYPLSFNHRLLPMERTLSDLSDKIGGAILPGLGNNYYLCVEKR
jgi:ubiquinone/menaquinone biosynthesis C-methylase UbiE